MQRLSKTTKISKHLSYGPRFETEISKVRSCITDHSGWTFISYALRIPRWTTPFKFTRLQHPLPLLSSQHIPYAAVFFNVKNSIYYPLNSLTINWCLITYVAAARERDKYDAERGRDWLKNERERLPHSSTSQTADAFALSLFTDPHMAETMLVPKTLGITVQTAYCK
jgi:hypothetical protein